MTVPGRRPMNLPSSRATIPLGRSPSFVTRTIFVSARWYWAGSITKSKTSCGLTPSMSSVASPLSMRSIIPRRPPVREPGRRFRRRAGGYNAAAMRRTLVVILSVLPTAFLTPAGARAADPCQPPRCVDVAVPYPLSITVPDDHVRIVLPVNYDPSGPGYPVLYLLHGAGDTYRTWVENTDLLSFTSKYRLI